MLSKKRMPRKKDQLAIFLAEKWPKVSSTNRWITVGPLQAYLRKSRRLIDGGYVQTLEIGNVQVKAPFRNKGIFKAFLEHMTSISPVDYLFVENVLSERFANFFRKNK